jgi:hypothetical protein
MRHRLMLVFPDVNQSWLLKKELAETFDVACLKVIIDIEQNLSEALGRFSQESTDLIITHLHIANDARSPLCEEAKLGIELLNLIKKSHPRVPSILVSPFLTTDVLNAVNALPQCHLFKESGATWQHKMVERAKQDLLMGPPSVLEIKANKKVNLEFFVNLDKDEWQMVSCGDGISCDETPIPLNVNMKKIKDLFDWGKRVELLKGNWPHWEKQLQDIGAVLVEQIFHKNQKVHNAFSELKGIVGGSENINIRFHVDKKIHPLILEALLEPDFKEKDEYWMLKAPICRRISVRQLNHMPLFEDEETRSGRVKINCLIVESDIGEKYVEEIDDTLKPLKNVGLEVEWLNNELQKKQKKFSIGHIEPVLKTECSKKKLEMLLTGGNHWDIVHFAGHSFYDKKLGTGYVFLPGEKQVEMLSIDKLSQWLRIAKARFIYMSSCHSSNEDFVYKLVKNEIPATVGYRWDIDDDKAAEHAEIFYSNLFKERSLEKAFLKTFQEVRDRHKEHIIWAAPVLIMQDRQK